MRSSHRSVGMCYRVEQKGQERQGQNDKTPFALCHWSARKRKGHIVQTSFKCSLPADKVFKTGDSTR
jgi:hypothetical protein